MDKRKICCFTELWESGGIEAFIFNTLRNMDIDGLEIHIVCARLGESVFTEPLRELGIKFKELSGRPRSPMNFKLFRDLLKRERYDVIHFHLFQAYAFRYIKYAQNAGVSTRAAHAHGAGLRESLLRPVKLCLHKIGRVIWGKSVTHRLACSEKASEFLFGDRSATVINNGIDTDVFRFSEAKREEMRKSLGIGEAPIVGHVGRFSREKNQSFLLHTFAELKKLRPEARLLLVGDGEDRKALEELACELGISGEVIFYGTSTDVSSLMCAMDVFLFPSLIEGLGIVAIEAQCSGLPVVCSEAIPREAHITPLLTSLPLSSGYAEWAKECVQLLCNSSERSSACDTVRRAGFGIGEVAEKIEKIYREP